MFISYSIPSHHFSPQRRTPVRLSFGESPEKAEVDPSASRRKKTLYQKARNNFLKALAYPLLGYALLDASGITDKIKQTTQQMTHSDFAGVILGEGFGHSGLCVGYHCLIQGCKQLQRARKKARKAKESAKA